jgi:hypothetical protein
MSTDWDAIQRALRTWRAPSKEYLHEAARLCTAASRLPEGVDPVKVLEEYRTPPKPVYCMCEDVHLTDNNGNCRRCGRPA